MKFVEWDIPMVTTANWKIVLLRFVGFGAGFGIVTAVLVGSLFWWSEQPKRWQGKAITAKPTELTFQQKGEELHIRFRYALTNNTNSEYTLPSATSGTLMRKLPNGGSLVKLADVSWDNTIQIPPKHSLNVVFESVYKFEDYDTSAEKLYGVKRADETADLEPTKALMDFVGRRFKEIDGLVFFDYLSKYEIELPKDWDNLK